MLFSPLSYDSNRIDLNEVVNHDVKLYAGRFTNRFPGIRKAAQPSTRRIQLDDGTRGYIRGIISCLVGFVGGKQSARPLQANVLPCNTLHTHSPSRGAVSFVSAIPFPRVISPIPLLS